LSFRPSHAVILPPTTSYQQELGWEPVVKSWLARRDPTEAALMGPLFDKYVQRSLDYIRLNLRPVMYNEAVCQVNTLLTLLNGHIKAAKEAGRGPLDEGRMERVFLFCACWALGGLLDVKGREALDGELRAAAGERMGLQMLGRKLGWEVCMETGRERCEGCRGPACLHGLVANQAGNCRAMLWCAYLRICPAVFSALWIVVVSDRRTSLAHIHQGSRVC
jgi:hypothetical protein